MDAFKRIIAKVATGSPLSQAESAEAFERLTSGDATPSQIGAFVMALRLRRETVDEITGAATALRARMLRVAAPANAIDLVGTGGDGSGSYNISTCAALVVAGAGIPVAKHGNRALSSRSGASDVLSALGVRTDLSPVEVTRCIEEANIGFMFAPNHHPALRTVAPTRLELGTRTVFNLLGPLLNPAGVRRHLIGIYDLGWLTTIAEVLGRLGSERAYVVHGADGLDEITLTGTTHVAELNAGQVHQFEIRPEELGMSLVTPDELRGGEAAANAQALLDVLNGAVGAHRDVVTLNAAAGLVIAGRAQDLFEGLALARHSIDSGAARNCLAKLIAVSQRQPLVA